MSSAPPRPPGSTRFGSLLRAWRTARGMSQLAVSVEAGVSSRHLSFVETGRASPSREMVLTLAEALAVPLRERNALLEAAGYAAVFYESGLDAPTMAEVRRALSHILEASEPNPTLVVNRRYDILLANEAAIRVLEYFAPSWRGRRNVASMLFSRAGLREAIENWGDVTDYVVQHLRRELGALAVRDADDERVLAEAEAMGDEARAAVVRKALPSSVLVPLRFRREGVLLEMFTTITTLGTPLDITLQELRIETMFPATADARRALQRVLDAAAN